MNKIEKLIQEYCPDGVEYKELGSICNIKTGKGITKKDGSDDALYPIISGGKELMGYYHEYNRLERTVTISRVGANAGYVNYINSKFYLNDKCFSIIPKEAFKDLINTKYLFYSLKRMESKIIELQSEGGVPTINIRKVSNINISLPSLLTQNKIVNILDKFIHLEEELNAELETRRKQYDFYLNQLMGFEDSAVEWKTLGEVGEFIRGNGLQKKDFTETGVGCIHYGQIYTHYGISAVETKSFVSPKLAYKLKKAQMGDLIIAITSENIDDVCKSVVWLGEDEIAIGGHSTIFRHKENPKFIAYYFQTRAFYAEKIKYARGTKVIEIKPLDLEKIVIPIPPLSEQERIVSILDKFDTLVNDTKVGIPAEIEVRRKQYAYYRNKLLTFGEYA